ncbi:MAG: transcriptional regulator, IclR family [Hyphomicrobiales bacterium]|nr:transcriptional regulator, IclR family [Hyphomicrobiales bacterium]
MDDTETRSGVASVERALALLRAFTRDRPRLSLAELAEATGLYKSTLLRLAQTLEGDGLLSRTPGGIYHLGPACLHLATIYQQAVEPAEIILPALRALNRLTGESACFNIRNGDKRVCVYRIESVHRLRDHVMVGDVIPLAQGAAGHILSAFSGMPGRKYALIRKRGLAISLEEVTPGVAAIAAPVFEAGESLAGALVVSGPRTRLDKIAIDRIGPLLLDSARDVTRQLGGSLALFEAGAG